MYEERGSVFEVVFSKSLEDNEASGWTEDGSNNHSSTVGPKLERAMAMFVTLNSRCYLFI